MNVWVRRLGTVAIVGLFVCAGVRTREVVRSGGIDVAVDRAPGDGLDEVASTEITFGSCWPARAAARTS
jgi:hypothetical protein